MKKKQITDNHSKYYRILLEIYVQVYKELGVDFDSVDKVDKWFMDYEMSHKRQEEIAESVLAKTRLQRWRKDSIMSAYWLGPSPKGIKGEDF